MYDRVRPPELASITKKAHDKRKETLDGIIADLKSFGKIRVEERNAKRKSKKEWVKDATHFVRVRPLARAEMLINSMLHRRNFSKLNPRIQKAIASAIILRALYLLDGEARLAESREKGLSFDKTNDPRISKSAVNSLLNTEFDGLIMELRAIPSDNKKRPMDYLSSNALHDMFFSKNEAKATEYAIALLRDNKAWSEIQRKVRIARKLGK